MMTAADFIRAAKGEDTQTMLTLVNVYQRLLKLPEGSTKDRLKQAGTFGDIRNEIATLSMTSQNDTEAAFLEMVKADVR